MSIQRLGVFETCFACNTYRMPEEEKSKNWQPLDCQTVEKTKKLFTCSRCQIAQYCSKACQQLHWATHKEYCKPGILTFSSETLRKTIKQFFNAQLTQTFAPAMMHANTLIKSSYAKLSLDFMFDVNKTKTGVQKKLQFSLCKKEDMYVTDLFAICMRNKDLSFDARMETYFSTKKTVQLFVEVTGIEFMCR